MSPNIKFVTSRRESHSVRGVPTLDCSSLEIVIEELKQSFGNEIAIDLETTGLDYLDNHPVLLVIGNNSVQFVIDYSSFSKSEITALMYAQKGKLILGHNLGFDLPFLLKRHGQVFTMEQIYDTMIAEQVLVKGTKASVGLDNTIKRRLNKQVYPDKKIRMEFTKMSAKNPFFDDRHIIYAGTDVAYLSDLKEVQTSFIKKYNQTELLSTNNKVLLVASQMKVDGMYVDKDAWMSLYYENLKKSDNLELFMDTELITLGVKQGKKRIKQRSLQTDIFGGAVDVVNNNTENINYGSSSQVLDVFRALKLPIPKSAKEDKDSIGEATIQQYLINHPTSKLKNFLGLLLQYKFVSKQANTFGKKWVEKYVKEDNRVHASFGVNRTATGRFSCSSPNIQQLPSDKRFRECFVGENNNLIFTCDYSSAELRILASLSGDKIMLDLLSKNADLHGYAATRVLRYLTGDETVIVDKKNNTEFRTSMKNVIFGLLYGAGVQKIAELLDISSTKAQQVYSILEVTFPQAFDYLDKVSSFGTSNGYIIFDDVYNQRRWFEDYFTGGLDKRTRGIIERACKNSPIQGQNGQMMKLAMVNVASYTLENRLRSKIISTVHDELVIELYEGEESHSEMFALLMKQAGDYFLRGIEMEAEPTIKKCWSK